METREDVGTEPVHDGQEAIGLGKSSLEVGIHHNTLSLRIQKKTTVATYNLERSSCVAGRVEFVWEWECQGHWTRGGAKLITSSVFKWPIS